MSIPFSQVVKLQSMEVRGPGDGSGPRRVKVFANSPSLGFDEAASNKPLQEFELGSEHRSGSKALELYFVKFQNVRSLQIFVEDNETGEEVTRVSKIAIFGSTVHTTNMCDFKKSG